VVIDADRIAAVEAPGTVSGDGDVVDLDGLVLAPGFIDCHTHYDAQVLWDPDLTPSSWHGVTTVVMGNCGFGIAPTRPAGRETIARTLENVEGMSVEALFAGIPWTFESFPEYLDAVERASPCEGPSAGGCQKIIVAEKILTLEYAEEMSTRTVDWTPPRPPGTGAPEAGGLRERKKRLMRQQLSDTATEMFLARGFDAVRVTEIAEACGVSEKTVFNYFPTKESLILDRLEATMASLRTGLAEPGVAPVEAALRILDYELSAMTSWLAAQDDPVQAGTSIRRFGTLIQDAPSLRAYQSDMMDQFTAVAAEILAGRVGMSPDDPEPQIAATALLGLWRIQFQRLSKYLDGSRTPAQVHQAVTADVHRAAQLINTGLSSLTA
jgi:AcrR family transcriptional regulator